MRCNKLLGLLAFAVLLNHNLAAAANPEVRKLPMPSSLRNGSSITFPDGVRPVIMPSPQAAVGKNSSTAASPAAGPSPKAAAPTRVPPRILETVSGVPILKTTDLTKGDIIAMMSYTEYELSFPSVLSGSTLEFKGFLSLQDLSSSCVSFEGVPIAPRGAPLALSRDNTLMFSCIWKGFPTFDLWILHNLTADSRTAVREYTALLSIAFETEVSTRSFVFAANGTAWAMANAADVEGAPESFLLHLDTTTLNTVEPFIKSITPAQHSMTLDAAPGNAFLEFPSGGPEVNTLSPQRLVFGFDVDISNVADRPEQQCTAALPMPDGTTIVGCAGPGNSTGRICAYHMHAGKTLPPSKAKLLHKWCVPAAVPRVPLPPQHANLSAEIFLALSANRESLFLSFNDYYQDSAPENPPSKATAAAQGQKKTPTPPAKSPAPVSTLAQPPCNPKAYRISLTGPSAWQQAAASNTLCGIKSTVDSSEIRLAAGPMVVFGGMPVSEQDCGTGACCSPLGTFLPNTTMCKDAGNDPCLEDAFCTGRNAGCPATYAEDFTPCSKAPRGLFTAVSGFSGATSPASVITPAEAALRKYKKCHLCYKGRCLKTTIIRKGGSQRRKGGDYVADAEPEEDWVYCV